MKRGGGVKERVRTWKWYCLELTLKSTILKEMYVLSWQQIHQWVIMLCKVFLFYTATQKSTHTDLGALYDYHTVFTQRHQLSVPLTPSKAASPHPVGMETDKKEERNQTLFFLLNILLTVITVTVFKNMNIDPYVVYYLVHGRQKIICLRIFSNNESEWWPVDLMHQKWHKLK